MSCPASPQTSADRVVRDPLVGCAAVITGCGCLLGAFAVLIAGILTSPFLLGLLVIWLGAHLAVAAVSMIYEGLKLAVGTRHP